MRSRQPVASPVPAQPSAVPLEAATEFMTSQGSTKAARRQASSLDDRPFAGTKVLVVDDDFRNVFALTAILERGDAEVIPAESGPAALEILEATSDFDIVLMDIRMPGMDGYTAIRAIRLFEQFKNLPIICVTSNVVAGERQRCMDAGANDYLPKPVDTLALVAAIGPWLPVKAQSTP